MVKVLCIDDEEEIRQMLADELSDSGYEVSEAANGRQGLEAIRRNKPDLVICDITMPVMDGHTLLAELRANHPEYADLPFVFLSALADRGHIVKGKKLGADDYVTKPVDFELLLATIESRLNQVQRMSERKNEQFVKLYRTLKGTGADAGDGSEPDRSAEEDRDAAVPSAAQAAPGGVQARVQDLAGQRDGRLLAGQMQIVGLDEIREALGEKWESRIQKVRELAETTIRKRLMPEDVFELADDDKFMICFASLDERAASFKAQSISHEIRERILGSSAIDPAIKQRCGVTSDVHTIEISHEEIAETEDLVDLVMSRITEAASASRSREQETIARLIGSCRIVKAPVLAANGKTTPIAVADFDPDTRSDVAALRNARPGSEDLASEIDILKLGKTSEALCKDALENQPVLLVNVTYSTIENRRLLERYQKVCAALTDSAKHHLALNVCGVPKDSVSSRTLPLLNPLRQYCRQVALELRDISLGNIDPKALRTPILTGHYRVLMGRIEQKPDALKRLIAELQAKKARLLIYGVPDREAARRLYGLGVDFVACSKK